MEEFCETKDGLKWYSPAHVTAVQMNCVGHVNIPLTYLFGAEGLSVLFLLLKLSGHLIITFLQRSLFFFFCGMDSTKFQKHSFECFYCDMLASCSCCL